MIAAIYGRAGDRQYVPLAYDAEPDRWKSLIGDRGRVGMISRESAALVCTQELAGDLERMSTSARQLRILTERRRHTPQSKRRMRKLATDLSEALESAEIDARRLLDAPAANDAIDIDTHAEFREQWTADDALYSFVADSIVRVAALTDNEYTDHGLDAVLTLIEQLRDKDQPSRRLMTLAAGE